MLVKKKRSGNFSEKNLGVLLLFGGPTVTVMLLNIEGEEVGTSNAHRKRRLSTITWLQRWTPLGSNRRYCRKCKNEENKALFLLRMHAVASDVVSTRGHGEDLPPLLVLVRPYY